MLTAYEDSVPALSAFIATWEGWPAGADAEALARFIVTSRLWWSAIGMSMSGALAAVADRLASGDFGSVSPRALGFVRGMSDRLARDYADAGDG